MATPTLRDAVAVLGAGDPVLAGLIERHGMPPPRRRVASTERFGHLAKIIVYQQLAGRAAAAIHGRLVEALEGEVTAERVWVTPPETLTSCGLSRSKAASLRDLAEKVRSGEVELARIGRLSDADVVSHLTLVRGLGPWSAQMFLIGTLSRLDVWPVGDFGVRAGYARAWALAEMPSPKELELIGEPFRPYRSLVAWYCWRAVEEER